MVQFEREDVPDRIYLDHASTTPILPQAAAAMAQACLGWANPSSPHAEGRAVRAQLEDARRRIAAALGWDSTVIFTSGATEAISLAFERVRTKERIVSAVEHPAVLRSAPGARQIAVSADGTLDLDDLDRALTEADSPLVAVQSVNNETGVIHPLDAVHARVKAAGGLLLVRLRPERRQAAAPRGRFHRRRRPQVRRPSRHRGPAGPRHGAPSTRSAVRRAAIGPGTAAVPSIMGFAAACEADHGWYEEAKRLRARLDEGISAAGGEIVAADAPRIATIACYRMPGVPGAAQMMQLDLAGIAVTAGSACASGSLKTSHVLTAMGWPEEQAREVIRVSFGPQTRESDIDALLGQWAAMFGKRRAA